MTHVQPPLNAWELKRPDWLPFCPHLSAYLRWRQCLCIASAYMVNCMEKLCQDMSMFHPMVGFLPYHRFIAVNWWLLFTFAYSKVWIDTVRYVILNPIVFCFFLHSALKFPRPIRRQTPSTILSSTCLMWARTTLREALSASISMCQGNDNHWSAESTATVLPHVART